jgi:hypothetical protein
MDSNRSRAATLVGIATAAGAFGVAAMMSAATAPTARADDFTDLISSFEQDFSQGQPEFASAIADYASGDQVEGLEHLLNGLDDDVEGPADTVSKATVDVFLNEPFGNLAYGFGLTGITVPDVATGVSYLEGDISTAEGEFAQAAMDLSSGDYGDAADQEIQASTFLIFGAEFVLEGAANSF